MTQEEHQPSATEGEPACERAELTDYAGSAEGRGNEESLAIWLIVVYALFLLAVFWQVGVPDNLFGPEHNLQIAEARSWWQGRMDLGGDFWDSALVDGRFFSPFPPMFSLISAIAWPIFGGVPQVLVISIAALLPWLAMRVFAGLSGASRHGALLTIALLLGTSLWRVVDNAVVDGSVYHVNHLLAAVGMLILLGEYFGRRRVWFAGIGLLIAVFSRQLSIFFVLPFIVMAWGDDRPGRVTRLGVVAATVAVALSVPLTLNWLKFKSPLDSGYMRIYEGRTDALAMTAKTHGLFSPTFLERNLYYANLHTWRIKQVEIAGELKTFAESDRNGTSIWWTSPILLWIVFAFGSVWRKAKSRQMAWLALSGFAVFAILMCHHSTGYVQRGFNRFSLDYILVLLTLITPVCCVGKRIWISVLMVAWSVFYFFVVSYWPHVELP